MPLGNFAAKIREAKSREQAPESIPSEIKETIAKLSEAEREELQKMNIDLADVDEILSTLHGLVVSTGMRRWLKNRLGKRATSDADMRHLKMDYNAVLAKLRVLEKGMTREDFPTHKVLMSKLSKIYDTIVYGGYAITPEETRQGFDEANL